MYLNVLNLHICIPLRIKITTQSMYYMRYLQCDYSRRNRCKYININKKKILKNTVKSIRENGHGFKL